MPPFNHSPKISAIYVSIAGILLTLAGASGGLASKFFAQKTDVATIGAQMLDMRERQDRMETKLDKFDEKMDKVYGILIKK